MADVLIRGKEMPKNCWHCEFNKSTLDRHDFCSVNGKQYNWGLEERPSDCPLIEVPPHGDLVDINALKLSILDVGYVNKHDYLKGVLNAINNAPTVIPASDTNVGRKSEVET